MVEEEILGVSRDKDEVEKVDRSETFWDYLTLHQPRLLPRPSREWIDSPYVAKNVNSVITEAELYIWRGLFWMPSDVHFWVPGAKDHVDQPPEGYIAMIFDTIAVGVRFPLHPVISDLLNFWNLAPTQITPNGWSIIMDLLTLFG